MSAPPLRRPSARLTAIVAVPVAILLILAAIRALTPDPPPPPFRHAVPTNGAPRTYEAALARVDQQLAGAQAQRRNQGDEWLVLDRLANAAMARARLTGSFDDYATAQAALDRAFATAPKGSGPHLTQAVLAFSLHRLAAASAALDAIDRYAVPAEAETRAEVSAMRGDIAFYRGDYAAALKAYQARGEVESAFRLAVYQGKTGQTDAALASIDRLEGSSKFPSAQFLANLDLMRGGLELQRGAWEKAAAHFTRAEALFPGFWLAQAHGAQALALSGRTAEAIARYQALAARSDSPEVMDALAALYRAQGDYPNTRAWADKAGAIWARRLAQFPEAAVGHAAEHELAFGDPKRALNLARQDYAARPYAASAIALAWAFVANNRPADALAVLRPVQASAWVSAEQHLVAAQAHALLGEADDADAEQQKALALNPRAADPAAALIWFGH